jgi:type II secretory pathway pseudopilin PulG
MRRLQDTPERGDEGFMLITAIVMIFMVLLVLSVAAPRVAKEIQRDREQESAHRAQQYTRAIRIFYQKFKRYPTSIEQLEKTNNQRFLRQRYIDPLTGKDDWRIIHVGENQTTVKGFFGDDLPGLTAGLGSAAGMASPSGSTFAGGGAATNSFGGASTPGGTNSSSTSAFGTPGTTQSGTGAGTSGTNSSLGSAAGMASQGGTDPLSGGGGPIMGIGSAKSGEAMLVVNEQTTYETWEFLYDPRIEQLYAKANLLGGIASGTGTSGFGSGSGTGLGSAAGMASPGTNGTPPATTTAPTANPPSTGP